MNFCVLNARLTHAAATDDDLNWMARVVDDESLAIALAVVITCKMEKSVRDMIIIFAKNLTYQMTEFRKSIFLRR